MLWQNPGRDETCSRASAPSCRVTEETRCCGRILVGTRHAAGHQPLLAASVKNDQPLAPQRLGQLQVYSGCSLGRRHRCHRQQLRRHPRHDPVPATVEDTPAILSLSSPRADPLRSVAAAPAPPLPPSAASPSSAAPKSRSWSPLRCRIPSAAAAQRPPPHRPPAVMPSCHTPSAAYAPSGHRRRTPLLL